jgi:toxin-antitoxin system PIN domain toxin
MSPGAIVPVLLDVNVLVALFDPDHVHHELAHDWFAENVSRRWATCPLTENGFVRVLANPSYCSPLSRATDLIERLRLFCSGEGHQFWADALSFTDDRVFNPAVIAGHRQLTDIYLLALARTHKGRLATFDRTIPVGAIVGGTRELLEVIAPVE